jgi:hypothetical protein
MKEVKIKVDNKLDSILSMLEKEIEEFENIIKTSKDGNKKVQAKKTIIVYKALYKYYRDKFKDIQENAEKELSNYIRIVDDAASDERVFEVGKSELVDLTDLFKDVTDENVKDEIMESLGQYAGSSVGDRFIGSNIPDMRAASNVPDDISDIEDNTYSINKEDITKVDIKQIDEEIEEQHGSSVAGNTTASDVAGETTASDVAGETVGSSVEGKISNVEEEQYGSNVEGETIASNVAGEMTASDVAGETTASNVAGEITSSDVAGETTASNVEGEIVGSSVAGKLVELEDDDDDMPRRSSK